MRYMLDTNICIYLLKRSSPSLLQRLVAHPPSDIYVSSITAAELSFGVMKSERRRDNAHRLELLLAEFGVAPFDDRAAEVYGAVRHALASGGEPIGPLDTLIAAHALALKARLVTNNEREFRRVKGLHVENWAAA